MYDRGNSHLPRHSAGERPRCYPPSRLEPGDVLVVTRLDRLARSTRDLLNVIAAITDRGAGFKSLKETVSACGVSPSFQSEPDID